MPFYWSSKSVPELAELPQEERRRILVALRTKPFRLWQYWGALLGGALVLFLLASVVVPALTERVPAWGVRFLIALAAITPVVVMLRHAGLHFSRPFIREYLQDEGSTAGEVDV